MAIKHVTVYECDACKKQLTRNTELTKLVVDSVAYELCFQCLENVREVLNPPNTEDVPRARHK